MSRSVMILLPAAFLVGACATGHSVATDGRRAILGMNADTFQSCAGIPCSVLAWNAPGG